MSLIRKHTPEDLGSFTPPWHMEAACRDIGEPEIFFPHKTDQDRYGPAAAGPYCNACPVMYECLKTALDGNEFGTWGGMTQSERVKLKNRVTRDEYATVEQLRELLEVTMPRCLDCDRHRKTKEGGRCAGCHRAHLKSTAQQAEEPREKPSCSEDWCDKEVHAKGKCSRHYHFDLRTANPGGNAERSRISRAKKKAALTSEEVAA
jgi:WhiB family redox-sensing transcriptional regulator